jgi:diguanylate cyclase (GGDEF)-like protein
VYRKLQENLIAWDVPVIFVTAAVYEQSEKQGLQLGAVDYITKPINPAILLLRIGNLMRLKKQEKELKRLAQYDALTGIPNRVLLTDRMKQAIAQANRHQNRLCICYLDFDGFKLINDTLGHEAGDHVLVEMTRRIRHILREVDTIARIGGDEFVVLLTDLPHSNEYKVTVQRILETIALPICIQDQSYFLTASIGINIYPDDNHDLDVLLLHADQAMYFAKQSGKNRYHLYNARHIY